MAKKTPVAERKLTSKEQLILCNLTGFKIKDNLAIKNDMADETRIASRNTLCSKSNKERLIMCSYHTETPLRTRNFGMYCPECASQHGELFEAVKPFAEIFETVRAAHEPREGHDRPEELRSFLDENQCVPSGSTIGHWRKLADAFRRLVVNS